MSVARRPRGLVAAVVAVAMCATGLIALPAGAEQAPPRSSAPIDRAVLEAQGRTSALVHVRADAALEHAIAEARSIGLDVGTVYERIHVFVAYGSPSSFRGLTRSPDIEAVEANSRIRFFTNSSHRATRGQDVLDGAVKTPAGAKIDGSGVGVAVVDSGFDGTHPDLAPNNGGNVKIVCTAHQGSNALRDTGGFRECLGPKTVVELEDTDTASAGGHGTHVAGIVAGTGTASGGTFHGAAPGATLYGVSMGTAVAVENAVDGLMWVLENHDKVSPPIKVVNNSWGSGHQPYEPNDGFWHRVIWKVQEALIAEGLTVVFAAGNAGGTGATASTGGECVNPTPGLVCVANYSDANNGTRNGTIASGSSRGQTSQPTTWPDVSAPGTSIVSTCRPHLPVCATGLQTSNTNYASISGTSMAAPHVSGIVAQLYQANPGLTPPQVEDILEDTAHKFAFGQAYGAFPDPFNPDNTSSHEKGHGLVDALAAVQKALTTSPGTPTTGRYDAFGSIRGSNPTARTDGGLTQNQFEADCAVPTEPVQGADGRVFEVPPAFATGSATAQASGIGPEVPSAQPTGIHDFDMYFYSADCELLGS